MTATYATQAPTRGQFETDSAPCQSFNCGPTDAAFVDGYYHDRQLSIDYVKNLATMYCQGTSAAMVSTMLSRLNVPCDPRYGTTVSLIKSVVAQRNRPVTFAVNMVYIPDSYSGDSFSGAHWLVGCANSSVNGLSAVTVMDSNAPASTGGFHAIPDIYLATALTGDSVIPRFAKVIALPDTATTEVVTVPAWVEAIKPSSGTIHFPIGSHVYDRPGHALTMLSKASSAVCSGVLYSSGVWYWTYFLATGGLRLARASETTRS